MYLGWVKEGEYDATKSGMVDFDINKYSQKS